MATDDTGLHLSCAYCGEKYDRQGLTADKCAEILEIWLFMHDGVKCRINAFWEKIKNFFGEQQ